MIEIHVGISRIIIASHSSIRCTDMHDQKRYLQCLCG